MVLLGALSMMIIFIVCGETNGKKAGKSSPFTTFRDIPGITAEEIAAIEQLKRDKSFFVYGMPQGTETFHNFNYNRTTRNTAGASPKYGLIGGFSVLMCNWLQELFDIPFKPAFYEWADLLAGLENGTIDFTGEITATPERRKIYFMTDAIAERTIKYFTLVDSKPMSEIAQTRLPRYAFIEGTNTPNTVASLYEPDSFETVLIGSMNQVYLKLKSGEIDAFFYTSSAEAIFDSHSDVAAHDSFPLIYRPVSLSAQNPELKPVISVVQKALENGSLRYLNELYNEGYHDYLKHKLFKQLSDDEQEYINYTPVVPFAAECDNYPISFYDKRVKEWGGIAFDILREVETLTGLHFERVSKENDEFSDVLAMLENGDAAIMSELLHSRAREGKFLWPSTSLLTDNYALISKSDLPNININEIFFLKVGLLKGTAHAALFRNWFPDHKFIIEYEGANAAFSALMRGEVDMVMTRQSRLLDLSNYREVAGYKANIVFEQAVEPTFGINKDQVILNSIMNKALQLIDTKRISGQWTRKTYDYRAKLTKMQIPWLIGAAILLLFVIILLSVLYLRNRSEGKRLESQVQGRTAQLQKQLLLMNTVNNVAAFLLESQAKDYYDTIIQSMKLICSCVDVDNVRLWQNSRKDDGRLYFKQVCGWRRETQTDDVNLEEFPYEDTIPNWEIPLMQGESICQDVSNLPEKERQHFSADNIQTILAIPIFLKVDFWGFASFECCSNRRDFSQAEEQVLRSWGLLAVGAIERGRIALNMKYTLTKLEAIISNYRGVIWSVDNDRVITNFNGQYLKTMGITPAFLEGKKLELARMRNRHMDIIENVEKTFREGPQDWISDIEGGVFHSYTTLMYDNDGNMRGIVGSTDDVTEMVKLQRDLKTAVEVAESASISKSKFLANMSHEMRTPLNAIIGLSEMELGSDNLEDETFINVEKIYNAGMNLLGIINDILDISKIESGKFSLIPVVYDLPSMINDTINLNVTRIGSKQIQFNLNIDNSLPLKLEGDVLRLKQIFNNLLSNAIKYTDTGSVNWSISCVREGNRVKLSSTVRDTGKGISEEDQKKLFSDYYQTDLKANYYVEGTGLGLAITLNLIKLMSGTISLKSEYGKGSEFTIELYQDAAGDELIGDEAVKNLTQFKYTAQRRSRNQSLIRADMSYAAVLIVDDVVTNLDVARGMLKPYKLHVDCVSSGQEAINYIRDEKIHYDAVFMDHMMPEMDGLEATKIIREEINTDYAKTVPIIALTANALIGNDDLFLKNGFQAFLSKPIDILKLDLALHQWVRDKEKEKALPSKETDVQNNTDVKNDTSVQNKTKSKNAELIKELDALGLNAKESLPRFGDDMEAYLQIIQSFTVHAPSFIEKAKSFEDLKEFRIAVHSIKGSGRGIGAAALGDRAEQLENAAKQDDRAFIEANNASFIEEAEHFIESVSAFLKTKLNSENKIQT